MNGELPATIVALAGLAVFGLIVLGAMGALPWQYKGSKRKKKGKTDDS